MPKRSAPTSAAISYDHRLCQTFIHFQMPCWSASFCIAEIAKWCRKATKYVALFWSSPRSENSKTRISSVLTSWSNEMSIWEARLHCMSALRVEIRIEKLRSSSSKSCLPIKVQCFLEGNQHRIGVGVGILFKPQASKSNIEMSLSEAVCCVCSSFTLPIWYLPVHAISTYFQPMTWHVFYRFLLSNWTSLRKSFPCQETRNLYPLEGAGDFDTKDVGIEAQAIVGDKNLTCDANRCDVFPRSRISSIVSGWYPHRIK